MKKMVSILLASVLLLGASLTGELAVEAAGGNQ